MTTVRFKDTPSQLMAKSKKQRASLLTTKNTSKKRIVYSYNKEAEQTRNKSQMDIFCGCIQRRHPSDIRNFLRHTFFPDRLKGKKDKLPNKRFVNKALFQVNDEKVVEMLAYLVLTISQIIEKRVHKAFIRILRTATTHQSFHSTKAKVLPYLVRVYLKYNRHQMMSIS